MHRLPILGDPGELEWRPGDVVLLTTKSQDSVGALERLEAAAGPDVAVACAQNGVANEREALRRFARTYSVCVQLPAGHLEPGVVVAFSAPLTGSLDVGCHPGGVDELATELARRLRRERLRIGSRAATSRAGSTRSSCATPRTRCGRCAARRPPARSSSAARATRPRRCSMPHGSITLPRRSTTRATSASSRSVRWPGRLRTLGSSWQSLARGAGSIEADHLNGEIVLEGRLHGVPAPVNELLRVAANDAARRGAARVVARRSSSRGSAEARAQSTS